MLFSYLSFILGSPKGEKSDCNYVSGFRFQGSGAAGFRFQDSSFKLLDSLREKSIKNPIQKSEKIDVTL